ncbi:MAG: D-alanine--D-alanine ligase [Oscillatoriales cyanobacterium SM2_1_8]|nr:D-alanine--D-alanine ligase [Oscillatoriales cyanobacterium SM2_1_8]
MSGVLTVGLLFGGRSDEHPVSIRSARAIAAALGNHPRYRLQPFYLDRQGFWHPPAPSALVLAQDEMPPPLAGFQLPPQIQEVDVWFPVLHGPNGEDGTVQGLLELLQKPYVGNGVLASAVGMDKILMKACFAKAGLPQVKYQALTATDWAQDQETWCEHLELELGYPCFVKPSNLGSSVGIAKVRTRSELIAGLAQALQYDRRVIVEEGVVAREIECAILGNAAPEASVVGEITYQSDFYDYETKYTAGKAQLQIPADLPPTVVRAVQAAAKRTFAAISGRGLARVDFFYVEASATILVNEINTLPGFTATSMYPKLWEASGRSFPALCDRLLELALNP